VQQTESDERADTALRGTRPGATPVPLSAQVSILADSGWMYVLLAGLVYLPMLLTKPGVVSDDTKTYLYLDPGKWLRQAPSMWDPNVALGSVTHQKIGYLLPMGPYYWATATLHVPTWVAQRIWLGTILFAAGSGALYLCRRLGSGGVGGVVAGVGYAFTPYVMQYAGHISVLLLPYAGLPWLVAFTVLALRRPGWRYPAMFALVVALVGGMNASSVVYVGVAPLLWFPYAVFVSGEATGRRALGAFVRIGVLTLLVSLWWLAGLAVEATAGINILKYTETVQATASASSPAEVVRGLGYWYFYGQDRLGLWTTTARQFMVNLGTLGMSYLMPLAAVAAAVVTRWRDRAYFVILLVIGVALSVASFPYEHPTIFGALVKAFMTDTNAGFALRSADRATPLVVLALAVLLGSGVAAVARRSQRAGAVVGTGLAALLVLANGPLLGGGTVLKPFSQPAVLPRYATAAARHLNAVHPGTRVYALPGNDFAAYRWGDTVDPIWPALLDRPFVTREQFIQGSMPTADLLYALDNPLQQGTADPAALAPIARLMSVGDVLVEYDQAYERYGVARPGAVAQYLTPTPSGLGAPVSFGTPRVNSPTIPMYDETYYGLPTPSPMPPLVVYPVPDTRPIDRAEPLGGALVVDGDAVGLVQAAALGRLAGNPTVFYAPTLLGDAALAHQVLVPGAQLVVTDTNRKQAFEWNSLFENTGYTQTATEQQSSFEANYPGVDLFPGAPVSARTTTVLAGDVASVTASAYGTVNTLRPEFRPANALDGNPSTAWETEGSTSGPVVGQWWQMTLKQPISADSVALTQPQPSVTDPSATNQWITRATLTFDGGRPVTVRLHAASRTAGGQVVRFSSRSFRSLRIRIDATNLFAHGRSPAGSSPVGFAEVGIHGITVDQVITLPSDLLTSLGARSAADRLTLILTRERVAPVPPRQDPETSLVRAFTLPTARTFALTGTARLSTLSDDPTVAALVGLGPAAAPGTSSSGARIVSATSSSRLPGDLQATAYATLDDDPSTAWDPGLGRSALTDPWLDYTFDRSVTVDHLDLVVASDKVHSIPTTLTISSDSGSAVVPLPAITPSHVRGSQTTVHLSFSPVTGRHLRLTFTGISLVSKPSYETSLSTALPIAVAEVTIPGVVAPSAPAAIPAPCRSDLLRVDGRPVSVTVSGSTAAALSGGPLTIATCGPDAGGLDLGPGDHLVQAAEGRSTGLDVDQLVFDSSPLDPPPAASVPIRSASGAGPASPSAPAAATPNVTVRSQTATTVRLAVSNAHTPFMLVMGQSINADWRASIDGGADLGAPVLVDGFADGWYVSKNALARHHGAFDVTLRFVPQRSVDIALVLSALALLACLGIVCLSFLRGRRYRRSPLAAAALHGAEPPDVVAVTTSEPAPAGSDPLPDDEPLLESPFVRLQPASRPWVAAAGVLAGAAVAYVIGGWFAGVAVGVGLACALTLQRGSAMLRIGALAMLGVAVFDVVLVQAVDHFQGNAGWPGRFPVASALVWASVLMLGADVALDVGRRWRAVRRRRGGRAAS